MSRTGFVRGVASENGRRLGCEHRLVATGDRAPQPSSRIHRAGQSEGGQSSSCGPAGCGRAACRATESGPSWSGRRDAGTGRARHTVCDSLQTARRPSRNHRSFPRPTEMAEAITSTSWAIAGAAQDRRCRSGTARKSATSPFARSRGYVHRQARTNVRPTGRPCFLVSQRHDAHGDAADAYASRETAPMFPSSRIKRSCSKSAQQATAVGRSPTIPAPPPRVQPRRTRSTPWASRSA